VRFAQNFADLVANVQKTTGIATSLRDQFSCKEVED
jgi:hypothetical protein